MSDGLYSVRMRASRGGGHISGAERIAGRGALSGIAGELIDRALMHERGRPDSVSLSVESLSGRDIVRLAPLPVRAAVEGSIADGRGTALNELVRAGVSENAAGRALEAITTGASPAGMNMRGAMILDASSGLRLDPDPARGVRARSVDYDEAFLPELSGSLKRRGLDRTHLREALALATKVAFAPYAVAELCISDDPSYVTGYVASPAHGYVRITPMKDNGDPMGGRAFFVEASGFDLDAYTSYLRETPVLISGPFEFG